MNRRNFFASLATGLAAAPAVVKAVCDGPLPDALTFDKLKQIRDEVMTPRVNPAWESAPYEVHFAMSPQSFKRMVPQRYVSSYQPNDGDLRCDHSGKIVERFL
jgi:hypothetical protein